MGFPLVSELAVEVGDRNSSVGGRCPQQGVSARQYRLHELWSPRRSLMNYYRVNGRAIETNQKGNSGDDREGENYLRH